MAGMTKKDLVDLVALKMESSKAAAKKAVEAVLEAIEEGVAKEGKVTVPGFGVFEKKDYVANVPAKVGDKKAGTKQIKTKVVRFKPGTEFKEKVKKA